MHTQNLGINLKSNTGKKKPQIDKIRIKPETKIKSIPAGGKGYSSGWCWSDLGLVVMAGGVQERSWGFRFRISIFQSWVGDW